MRLVVRHVARVPVAVRGPFVFGLFAVLVALALASCGGAGAASVTAPDASKDPQQILSQYTAAKNGLPSVAVAVIRSGEVVYEGAAGVRERGNPEPVTTQDSFHIGSDTKAMTALLCAILVERGLLTWTTTVGQVLGPDFPMRDEYRPVTLEQLLSHTSGLPAELPDKVWRSFFPYDSAAAADRSRMVTESLSLAPQSAAGSTFLYSNLGYVVAAFMAEKVTGSSWETLMQQEVFIPLGMSGAGFGPPALGKGDKQSPGAPWGHSPDPVDPASAYADNPTALGPAGTVHASLQDLEKYVGVFWSSPVAGTDRPLVGRAALDELLRPRLSNYALGWGVLKNTEGNVCITHDGSNTMFYCSIVICPTEKNALIVLTNRGDGDAAREVGELMLYFAERFPASTP